MRGTKARALRKRTDDMWNKLSDEDKKFVGAKKRLYRNMKRLNRKGNA